MSRSALPAPPGERVGCGSTCFADCAFGLFSLSLSLSVSLSVYTCMCIYICIHTFIYTYIYIYIYLLYVCNLSLSLSLFSFFACVSPVLPTKSILISSSEKRRGHAQPRGHVYTHHGAALKSQTDSTVPRRMAFTSSSLKYCHSTGHFSGFGTIKFLRSPAKMFSELPNALT